MTSVRVNYQVMWSRLIAVVEEQAATLVRTAFSTSVREAGDLSAGLFDQRARMMVQAVTGTPGHVNAMAESVGHFAREIGVGNMYEGDVYLTNDPWFGTGHLHDITTVTPVYRAGKHIGYFACTAHVVDIGGRGFGPDAGDVFEEGLQIPICKLAERGIVDATLLKLIDANVRTPDQTIGDIFSLAACNEAGNRRLQTMLDEYDLDDLEGLSDYIIGASFAATCEAIRSVPDGSYENSMTVDGYEAPVTLKVRLGVEGDSLVADFDGTSGVSSLGVNVPEVYTRAYACFGLKVAIAPDVPNNAGSLSPFRIVTPKGSILAAERPAPVSVRHVLGHFIPDVVLGALHQALPGKIPAEGASALWNIQISARPLDRSQSELGREILMFNSGGTGARALADGMSATAFPSGVSTMSVEATEQVGPITVWRKELRPDSGGPGRYRGGLGQIIEIEPRDGFELWFNAMFDRVDHPARGRDGGAPGAAGAVELATGEHMQSKGRQHIRSGQRLRLLLPGGGGRGQPESRDPSALRADIAGGYVSRRSARHDYRFLTDEE